jgi:hypothetical protein
LVPIIALSIFIIALSCVAIRYFQQRDFKKYWISMNASIILMLFFAVTVVIPVMDDHKSFVPFCRAVTATVPINAPLYGYQPDETLRGAVPFYTGRNVIETEDLQDIMLLLKKDEPFFIVIRDKRDQIEKELLNTGKLSVLVKQMMGTDRTLVLLSNVPTQGTITIGEPFEKIKKVKRDKVVSP